MTKAKPAAAVKARGAVTNDLDQGPALQLRVDAPAAAEDSQAAETHDARVRVPWPIPASTMIDFYLSSPWLGAVGNLLADAVSSAKWDLAARDVDTLGQPLDRASDFDKAADTNYRRAKAWLAREDVGREGVSELDLSGLLRALALANDQTGNVFVEVLRSVDGAEPRQLSHLLPQFVWYEARDEQSGKRLVLRQEDPFGKPVDFVPFGARGPQDRDVREFLHQRQTNLASSYYGLPAWIPSRDSVEVDNEHRKYLRGFFKNHGTPRYMVTVTQDPAWQGAQPGDDALDELFKQVQGFLQANAGAMSGRNLILQYPGGITVTAQALDHKIEDPTFPNTAKLARDEILAVRHVSLLNLGLPEGGYRATAEQQSMDFQTQVLAPFAAPAVAIINRILHAPPPHGLGVTDYDFVLEFQDVEQFLRKIEALVKAAGAPILSQAEARQVLGWEPAGETKPLLPSTMIPAADFGAGGPDAATPTD